MMWYADEDSGVLSEKIIAMTTAALMIVMKTDVGIPKTVSVAIQSLKRRYTRWHVLQECSGYRDDHQKYHHKNKDGEQEVSHVFFHGFIFSASYL